MLNHQIDENFEASYIEEFYPLQEEINSYFPSEEEAIYALYEQLFHSSNNICKLTILNSMKYLIFKNSMTNQIEEITHMREEDLWITHEKEKEKSLNDTTQEIKNKLYAFLEEEII